MAFSSESVFVFKQKTAYEPRISDWSSDVCSSDLPDEHFQRQRKLFLQFPDASVAQAPDNHHRQAEADGGRKEQNEKDRTRRYLRPQRHDRDDRQQDDADRRRHHPRTEAERKSRV